MQQTTVAVALGLVIGLFSGLFGVGGSSISTPLLRIFLGTPRLIALGSPLPASLPTAAAGSIAYHRHGLVNRRVMGWTVAGGLPTVVAGSLLTRWVPSHWLMFLIAAGVMAAALQLVRSATLAERQRSRRSGNEAWLRPPVAGLLGVAAVVGLLSGLLANGGGFLLVPAFILLFGARVREAAATSLPCIAFFAVPGTVVHAWLGHVDGWLSVELSLGVIPATYLGARLSLWLRRVRLRLPFGVLMSAFGIYFFVRELLKTI
jgi:uncharacterized membrane protein YfcA